MSRVVKVLFCILLFTPASGFAQSQTPPCQLLEFRQFDFWLGQWRVMTPAGTQAGESHIERILGACVIKESYQTSKGYKGHSFNIYDRVTEQWHQNWVDNSGLLLQLKGGLVDGSMVLSGPGKNAKGEALIHRISWTPNDDGTVRQHWQTSTDQGRQWQTLFDGLYHKSK